MYHHCVYTPGVIDGNWAQWGDWSQCSQTCGEGIHTRQRACSNPAPKNGGKSCEGLGNESRKCLIRQCNAGMYLFLLIFFDLF